MRKLTNYFGILLSFTVISVAVNGQKASDPDSSKKVKTPVNQAQPTIVLKVKVIDIDNSAPIDSAAVTVPGEKTLYTDKNGMVEFPNAKPNTDITIRCKDYISQSKKAKANLQFRLVKSGTETEASRLNNQYGQYSRPIDFTTGAYKNISGDDLRKLNSINIIDALAIADPAFTALRSNSNGDNPNSLPAAQIRGATKFPASASISTKDNSTKGYQILPSTGDFVASQIINANQPVFLLDGIQVSIQQVIDMDINRIESVSIMKDAATTATYGSRASNGIVLVQTKKKEKGSLNVHYTGQMLVSTADLSSYQLLNSNDKFGLEKKAGFYDTTGNFYKQRNAAVQKGVNTNWLQEPIQTGVGTYQSLMLDGGDDNLNYGLDLKYKNMSGVMKGSKREDFEVGLHIGARFKSFTLKNYMSFSRVHATNSSYGNFSDYEKMNPFFSPYDSVTGTYAKVVGQYKYTGANGADSLGPAYNPAYNSSISNADFTEFFRFSNTTSFDWILGNGFSVNGRIGVLYQGDETDLFMAPGNTVFGDYAPSDFFKRGLYTLTKNSFTSFDGALMLNYARHKNRHYFNATAGTNALSTKSNAESIVVQGFVSDKIANIAFGTGYSNSKPATGMINNTSVSLFSNLTYSYDLRYNAELTYTREGVSEFSSNNRYGNYWSAGMSWNLHNEHFFHANNLISQLRLKLNTGVVGSQYFQSYLSNTTYNYFTNQQYVLRGSNLGTRGVGLGAFLTGMGNENLKSPTTSNSNIGIDLVLLNNRLFIHADQFWQQSNDLVLPIYSPNYTGFRNFAYYDNLGSIANNGFEFSIDYAAIRNKQKSIYLNVQLNGMQNNATIKATSSYIDSLNVYNNSSSVNQTQPQAKYLIGNSLSTIWAVPSLGIDPATGKERLLKADGSETFVWDAADKRVMGDYLPKWQGSFGSSLSVKKWAVSVYFNYQFGGKFYNQTLADKVENADMNYSLDSRAASNRWTKPGDIAGFKALSANGLLLSPTYATSRFIENNDQLSCASFSLSYTWPYFKGKDNPFQNTSIAITGNNLFSIVSNNDWEKGTNYPFAHMYSLKITTSIK